MNPNTLHAVALAGQPLVLRLTAPWAEGAQRTLTVHARYDDSHGRRLYLDAELDVIAPNGDPLPVARTQAWPHAVALVHEAHTETSDPMGSAGDDTYRLEMGGTHYLLSADEADRAAQWMGQDLADPCQVIDEETVA